MKTPLKPESGWTGVNLIKFSQDEVNAALYNVDDLMSRALIQTVYLAFADIGRAIKENVDFDGQELEFGVERRYVTPEVLFVFKSYTPPEAEFTEDGFSYKVGRVPVEIKFVSRRYKFFEHPEKLIYKAGEFQIPNPFDKYFKARWIIR